MRITQETAAELYRAYYRPMLRAAQKILKNPADSEDAVQDAFVKILKCGGEYPGTCSAHARALSITIAKQAAIDAYRKKHRLVCTSWEERGMQEAGTRELQREVEEKLSIQSGMEQLTCVSKKALVLHEYYGYDTKEIAARLNLRREAVKKRLQRARAELQSTLI